MNDKIEIIYNKSKDKYNITHVQIKIYPKTTMEKIIFIGSMVCVYHNSLSIKRSYNKNDKEILIIYQNISVLFQHINNGLNALYDDFHSYLNKDVSYYRNKNDYYLGKKLEQLCIKMFDRNKDRIKKSLVQEVGL